MWATLSVKGEHTIHLSSHRSGVHQHSNQNVTLAFHHRSEHPQCSYTKIRNLHRGDEHPLLFHLGVPPPQYWSKWKSPRVDSASAHSLVSASFCRGCPCTEKRTSYKLLFLSFPLDCVGSYFSQGKWSVRNTRACAKIGSLEEKWYEGKYLFAGVHFPPGSHVSPASSRSLREKQETSRSLLFLNSICPFAAMESLTAGYKSRCWRTIRWNS